jgi:phenylalanyl-tRNA synthetase beta chain
LEIKVNNVTETGLGLTVPAYRNDVQREADIIEEILRVYGYNNVGTTEKLNASISNSTRFEDFKLQISLVINWPPKAFLRLWRTP